MAKTIEITATYLISLHDLADKLGIWAKRILSVEAYPDEPKWDEPAIKLTVLIKTEDEEGN